MSKSSHNIKVKSHVLSLLGDELIGNDGLAIFELIKNSYDADSGKVEVELNDVNTPNSNITITDDGCGMDKDTLVDVWCVIGTDYKRGKNRKLSKKNRASLGEKGVGRLAVYKLGNSFTLITKTEKCNCAHKIEINWKQLIDSADELSQIEVEIEQIDADSFGMNHGTKIIISNLRKQKWEKKEIKDLARKVTNIKTPFRKPIQSKPHDQKTPKIDSFDVLLKAEGEISDWIDEVKSIDEVLDNSVYYFDFFLSKDGKLSTTYEFSPPKKFDALKKRRVSEEKLDLLIPKNDSEFFEKDQKILKAVDLAGIGELCGRFYVYNLESAVLNSLGQNRTIKSFVKENCGVRIHRDGIRVYKYGEPDDDWLGMLLRRLNRVGDKFSKNTTIGAIDLDLESSFGLKEMTNREGFDQNKTYHKFVSICINILNQFEKQAIDDRDALKAYLEGIKPVVKSGFYETLDELDEAIEKKNLTKQFKSLTTRIRSDYTQMRDLMVNSGMAGLNLTIVFHELVREIEMLQRRLSEEIDVDDTKNRLDSIAQLLENFSPILKPQKKVEFSIQDVINHSEKLNKARFRYHEIEFENTAATQADFTSKGPKNLLISLFSNIIDNSIYWLDVAKEKGNLKSQIKISLDHKNYSGPAVIIEDSGDGFKLPPEELINPFKTLKPDGMGVGLYFSNLVMESFGSIEFPNSDNGAKVVLIFNNHG